MNRWSTSRANVRSNQPGRRAGLTTLEMLLVLAIIVMVVGMSLPALEDAYKTREIENAGEFVRQKLAEGRTRAIETGLVYQFRYEPGKSRFVILPELDGIAESTDGSKYYRFSGELLESIHFREELDSVGSGENLDAEWFEGLPDAHELSQTIWSEPVEFHFEGNAEDSYVFIMDDEKRSIKLSIRGLTGMVSVARVSWEAAD